MVNPEASGASGTFAFVSPTEILAGAAGIVKDYGAAYKGARSSETMN
jgi:hypothetical protein